VLNNYRTEPNRKRIKELKREPVSLKINVDDDDDDDERIYFKVT